MDLLVRDAELMYLERRTVEVQRFDDLMFEESKVLEARVVADGMASEAEACRAATRGPS